VLIAASSPFLRHNESGSAHGVHQVCSDRSELRFGGRSRLRGRSHSGPGLAVCIGGQGNVVGGRKR
jgi:hypothetical protein